MTLNYRGLQLMLRDDPKLQYDFNQYEDESETGARTYSASCMVSHRPRGAWAEAVYSQINEGLGFQDEPRAEVRGM